MSKASCTCARVARGTVPTTALLYGFTTSIWPLPSTLRPAMRKRSCRIGLTGGVAEADALARMGHHQILYVVQRHVENVEVAQVRVHRQIGLAIDDQRHFLLGDAAMRAQRLLQA